MWYYNIGDLMNVVELLEKVKIAMENKDYDMVPTLKNRNSKRKYGLTQYDIEEYISSLEINDLIKGPEPDRDCPGEELFIFKKEIINKVVFYTKIKYKNKQVKILSCHEDE